MTHNLSARRYIPILRARAGEIDAIRELFSYQKSRVLPLFDVFDPRPGLGGKKIPVWLRDKDFPYRDLTDNRISDLVVLGMPIILDCFNFDLEEELAPNCLAYQYIFKQANSSDNLLIPCIGYDRWSEPSYRKFLEIECNSGVSNSVALRIDRSALDDLGPDQYFLTVMEDIVKTSRLDTKSCVVVVDLGDLTELDQIEIVDQVSEIVRICKSLGFALISIGGASFPDSVSKVVKRHWDSAIVPRLEKDLFVDVVAACGSDRMSITDYGVRNPRSHEGGGNNANGKIRYTISDGHFTFRGTNLFDDLRTGRIGYGFKQMHQLAADVVALGSYPGPTFSWGDAEIHKRAVVHQKPGNLSQWIAFDTNRHVSFVGLEVQSMLQEARVVSSSEFEEA